MDFDQMLESWKAQDEKPLYGVNGDLLRLVLQNERDRIRRTLRRDQWITYLVGPGMALFGAAWLWIAIVNDVPPLHANAAGLGAAVFALWVGAFWVSRRRQARRERAFSNSLKDEIGRNLSLVEYQIANGRWGTGVLWTAPAIVGSALIYWLTFQVNTDSGFTAWNHASMAIIFVWALVWIPYKASREVKRKLEPRRQHLRELLDALDAGD